MPRSRPRRSAGSTRRPRCSASRSGRRRGRRRERGAVRVVVDSAGAMVLGDAQSRIAAVHAEIGPRPRSASTATRTCRSASPLGARVPDRGPADRRGAVRARRRAGNSPTEVLAAVFDRLGVPTGIDPKAAAARRGRRAALHPPATVDGPRRPSCRATPACTPRSCCTPSGQRTATGCRRTRSCNGWGEAGYVGDRRNDHRHRPGN